MLIMLATVNIHADPVTINHPVMKQLFFIIQPGNESRFNPHCAFFDLSRYV